MSNLITELEDELTPLYSLVVYKFQRSQKMYVECAKVRNGNAMAYHPLTIKEASSISNGMQAAEVQLAYLDSGGILPTGILSVQITGHPRVVWHTPAMKAPLLFQADLGVANATYPIPPMIWMATKDRLTIYAVKENERPTEDTLLYLPPFHNVFGSCEVCMGTVRTHLGNPDCIEEFTEQWQQFFFSSYFTHLGSLGNPTRSPLERVWKSLHDTDRDFPLDELVTANKVLKDIL
jgi:PRTRC genetic system protein B